MHRRLFLLSNFHAKKGNRLCGSCTTTFGFTTVYTDYVVDGRLGAKDKCDHTADCDQNIFPHYPVVSTKTFLPVNDNFNGNLANEKINWFLH